MIERKVNMTLCEKELNKKIENNKIFINTKFIDEETKEAFKAQYEAIEKEYPITMEGMIRKMKTDILYKILKQEELYNSHNFVLDYKDYLYEEELEGGRGKEYRIETYITIKDADEK